MKDKYSLGLDFGTESVRAVLARVVDGEIVASSVSRYADGVIDDYLPGTNIKLRPNWALQNPQDWLDGLEKVIIDVTRDHGITPESLVGIGVDFTACTLVPTLEDGTPLCFLAEYRQEPHAWVKLWKHHGAQDQANRINQIGIEQNWDLLPYYGGKISSEWLLPKALEILEEVPEIYQRITYFIEGADWVTWQLTGELTRNTCCSGYKGPWQKKLGFPGKEFLISINPGLADLFERKVSGPILAPGQRAGGLSKHWAQRLNLAPDCPVSAGIIDAHAGAIGAGVSEPGVMLLMMGTSTCHMLLSEHEVLVEGISGVVEDGIIPGLFGYEAGQAGVGDIFSWFVNHCVPQYYYGGKQLDEGDLHNLLIKRAEKLIPGESGLLALDWWNGCRTPLVDADLSGMILGCTLQTKPEEIYRALIEATAFGTRMIIDLFQNGGIEINTLRAGGGLIKNNLLLKIYADVTNLPIEISPSELISGQGAAILGAVAGDAYQTIHEAVRKMTPPISRMIEPNARMHEYYNHIYREYERLLTYFGRDPESPMKRLTNFRNFILQEKEEQV
ncbi:MAG TPA: ribulokinase [Brevefilum sp.]|nr:ribulokinase [Brevefilum sp.]